MSAQRICNRINEFGSHLLENEDAIDFNMHIVSDISRETKQIIWSRSKERGLIYSDYGHIDEYLGILRNRDYSYLMADGGIIQIAYTLEGTGISRHRLSFYPCPFDVVSDQQAILEYGLVDFIEEFCLNDPRSAVRLRSPLRFDFAPEAGRDYHPSCHLTFQSVDCRIPVLSAIGFEEFVRFLFENFYFSVWQRLNLATNLTFSPISDVLTPHDRGRFHVNWQIPR